MDVLQARDDLEEEGACLVFRQTRCYVGVDVYACGLYQDMTCREGK